MSLPTLITSGAEAVAFMFFAGSTTRKARCVFERPYFDMGVKLQMATIGHKFEIIKGVMKGVLVNMVDNFMPFKFTAKVLLHHPSVFIGPIFFIGPYFNSDVFQTSSVNDPFGKKGECTGMGHSFLASWHNPLCHIASKKQTIYGGAL